MLVRVFNFVEMDGAKLSPPGRFAEATRADGPQSATILMRARPIFLLEYLGGETGEANLAIWTFYFRENERASWK